MVSLGLLWFYRWEKEVQNEQRVTCYGKACTESEQSLSGVSGLSLTFEDKDLWRWGECQCGNGYSRCDLFPQPIPGVLFHCHRQWHWPGDRCTMLCCHILCFVSDFWHPKCQSSLKERSSPDFGVKWPPEQKFPEFQPVFWSRLLGFIQHLPLCGVVL